MSRVPATAFGNPAVDPDWTPPTRQITANGFNNAAIQIAVWEDIAASAAATAAAAREAEGAANPAPLASRNCFWLMLVLSSLFVLHGQQVRYAKDVRWHGGLPDASGPFPWEIEALLAQSDSFKATFLVPVIRRASTFVQPAQASQTMVITGLDLQTSESDELVSAEFGRSTQRPVHGLSAVIPDAVVAGLLESCPRPEDAAAEPSSRGSCYLGLQRVDDAPLPPPLAGKPSAACYRFVAGEALSAMAPLPLPKHAREGAGLDGRATGYGCIMADRLDAAVPTASNSTVVLAWDPHLSRQQVQALRGSRESITSCLSAVSVPSMASGPAVAVDGSTTVLFDRRSSSVVNVAFSATQSLVVEQFDSTSLRLRWRYRLPLSVAWLLQTSRVSDGYLLFVGSEHPFVGTIFVIDLTASEVYEQDPPPTGNGRQLPRRRRLPRAMFVDGPGDVTTEGAAGKEAEASPFCQVLPAAWPSRPSAGGPP